MLLQNDTSVEAARLLTVVVLWQNPQLLLVWQGLHLSRILHALDSGFVSGNECSMKRRCSTVTRECKLMWWFVIGTLNTLLPGFGQWSAWSGSPETWLGGWNLGAVPTASLCSPICARVVTNGKFQSILVELWNIAGQNTWQALCESRETTATQQRQMRAHTSGKVTRRDLLLWIVVKRYLLP